MSGEYSWEIGSSTYTPPQREGLGWYVLVAVVLALAIHVGLLIFLGGQNYHPSVRVVEETYTGPMRLEVMEEDERDLVAEEPPEEVVEKPEDVNEALMELENLDVDVASTIEEAEVPKLKIEKPKLAGAEDGDLEQLVVGSGGSPEIPDPGKVAIDFPDAKEGQIVTDLGAPLSDVLDPDALLNDLGNRKGAGGDSESGVLDGYTGLDEYAKMSPGDLQRNKASIGSDLLFEFNSSTLRDDARLTLLTVAMLIDRNPGMYCWVEGHTDLFGSDDFNERLSARRSQAVKDWLVRALDLDPKFIVVRAMGKSVPVVVEGDRDAQAPNRRVDIKMRKTLPPVVERPVRVVPGKAVVVPEDEESEGEEEIPKAEPVEEEIPVAVPVD